ncbi:MAG: universal stress protein [Acidimicrobiia bacterium]|nr:universal stress protein [Acidimicrobiia bacterium]
MEDHLTKTAMKPVLVPVDFSKPSEEALVWAGDLVARTGSPLIVVHVIHEVAPGSYVRSDDGNFERYESAAADMMDEFVKKAATRQPTVGRAEQLLVEGLPVTRILEVAEAKEARHIVMGSHGRTGLSHFMLGSKAERVVQLAPIPVTIVKGPQPETHRENDR